MMAMIFVAFMFACIVEGWCWWFPWVWWHGDCDGFGVCHADADDDQRDVDGDGDSDVCSNYNDNMISDDNNFFVLNSNNINGN